MAARTRTAPLRVSAGEARALLAGLALIRKSSQVPEALDPLAERLARLIPASERDGAMTRYRTS